MWGPLVISWFINTNQYNYLRIINHSEIEVLNQFSYLRGPTLYLKLFCWPRGPDVPASGQSSGLVQRHAAAPLLGGQTTWHQNCILLDLSGARLGTGDHMGSIWDPHGTRGF